jgi:hypothetical protein
VPARMKNRRFHSFFPVLLLTCGGGGAASGLMRPAYSRGSRVAASTPRPSQRDLRTCVAHLESLYVEGAGLELDGRADAAGDPPVCSGARIGCLARAAERKERQQAFSRAPEAPR